jgi:small subunit ribosomal protein S4
LARQQGTVCRLCRRQGEKLFLKGERCMTGKCAFEKRPYAPGQHGPQAQWQRRPSAYSTQLKQKQKARRIYGVLERQFRRYLKLAQQSPGLTGSNLVVLLERRLDNVVYRLGFADSRAQARQLVGHGHFNVNGRRMDIPSYLCKPGDVIGARPLSQAKGYFKELAQHLGERSVPGWLSLDAVQMTGSMLSTPLREEIDTPLDDQAVVGFYSR